MKLFLMFISLLMLLPSYALDEAQSREILEKILSKGRAEEWASLPMNERIGKIALEFLNTPYVGGTLDCEIEKCQVDLEGLDCVTYFESVIGIAKILEFSRSDYDYLRERVAFTRYRGGEVKGYVSRLHYTSDWITDNVKKKVVKDVTKSLGGVKFPVKVSYMSEHPESYAPLKADKRAVDEIRKIEKSINRRHYLYVKKEKVAGIEDKIKTGDIICIATDMTGLDYSHTGFAYRDESGVLRLLHASSSKKKVVLDVRLSDYLAANSKATGITVLRVTE